MLLISGFGGFNELMQSFEIWGLQYVQCTKGAVYSRICGRQRRELQVFQDLGASMHSKCCTFQALGESMHPKCCKLQSLGVSTHSKFQDRGRGAMHSKCWPFQHFNALKLPRLRDFTAQPCPLNIDNGHALSQKRR